MISLRRGNLFHAGVTVMLVFLLLQSADALQVGEPCDRFFSLQSCDSGLECENDSYFQSLFENDVISRYSKYCQHKAGQRSLGERCSTTSDCNTGSNDMIVCDERCKRCASERARATSDLDSVGVERVLDSTANAFKYKQCNLGSNVSFVSWDVFTNSSAPELFPKTESELRSYVLAAASANCTIRPAGTGHSGNVLNNDDTNIVAISLARYRPENNIDANNNTIDWYGGGKGVFVPGADSTKATARFSAGQTYLDVFSLTRPLGFVTPTQTAGFFFSLGGTIANSVHGGVFGASYMHAYVIKMQVMLANGTVTVISGDDKLKYWRNSYGLLGIITAVEFKLRYRPNLNMGSSYKPVTWNQDELDKHMLQYHPEGCSDCIYGDFFLDGYTGRDFLDLFSSKFLNLNALTYKNNKNATYAANVSTMIDNYARLHDTFKNVSIDGGSDNELLGDTSAPQWLKNYLTLGIATCITSSPLGKISWINEILTYMVHLNTAAFVRMYSKQTNDGFYIHGSPKANFMGYIFAKQDLFKVLDSYHVYTQKLVDLGCDFTFNSGLEFRYISVTNATAGLLAPQQPRGERTVEEYVVIEIVNIATIEPEPAFMRAFMELEQHWLNLPNLTIPPKPHTGKLFGFCQTGKDKIEPFCPEVLSKIYDDTTLDNFNAYRNQVDPNNTFFGGMPAKFFPTPSSAPTLAPFERLKSYTETCKGKKRYLSAGAIAGIVIGSLAFVCFCCYLYVTKSKRTKHETRGEIVMPESKPRTETVREFMVTESTI